jgi:hypothetical protein
VCVWRGKGGRVKHKRFVIDVDYDFNKLSFKEEQELFEEKFFDEFFRLITDQLLEDEGGWTCKEILHSIEVGDHWRPYENKEISDLGTVHIHVEESDETD